MDARYRDAAHTLVTVTLEAEEVLNGEPGPGTWQLGLEASAAFVAAAQAGGATIDPYAAPVQLPRMRSGRALRYALNALKVRQAWEQSADALAAAGKPDDLDYWLTLGSGDLAPETNPKLGRIAGRAQPPIDLRAVYDAAPAPG